MTDSPFVFGGNIHEADVAATHRAGAGYDFWLAYRAVRVSRDWRRAYQKLRMVLLVYKDWRRRSWWKAWIAEAPDGFAAAGGWTEARAVANLRRKLDAEETP